MGEPIEVFARTPDGREHHWFTSDADAPTKTLPPSHLLANAIGHLHHLVERVDALVEYMAKIAEHTHGTQPGCEMCDRERRIRELQEKLLTRTVKEMEDDDKANGWRDNT